MGSPMAIPGLRAVSKAVRLARAMLIVGAAILRCGPDLACGQTAARPRPRSAPVTSITFREELSIGVPEGEESEMFGSHVVFNVDEKGFIYATDLDAKQIKKFGPDGKHVLTFGRKGQGPGEFQNPSAVRFLKDGTLYVSEGFGNKIVLFDERGVYLRQSLLPGKFYDLWITPAGTYLGSEQVAPQYVGQGPVETFVKLYDRDFKPILELHRESFVFPDRSLGPAEGQARITSEFLARPTAMAAMGPDGRIYFGRSDVYAIDILAPEGRKLMTISRDVEALPYSERDRDFILKEDGELMTAMMRSESLTKEYLRLIRFPKNKPFFRALVPMDDGGLAVVVDIDGYTAAWLDLFDRQGTFLGRVRASIPALNLMFKKGKAYALHRDDSGFLSIKRYGYELSR
jgi:hypothetical protein